MRANRRKALDLLMTQQPDEVAQSVGVRLTTLETWMRMDDFRKALRAREQEQKRALARLSRQAALSAAQSLCAAAERAAKPDPKILLEIIKASGAFEAEEEDPAEAVADVLRAAREGAASYV